MKALFEQLLYVGGAILVWGKLGSVALSLALILYGCYRFNKFLTRANVLGS